MVPRKSVGSRFLLGRAALIVGTAALETGCGAQLPGGFLQVDLSRPWSLHWSDSIGSGQTAEIELAFPADPSLIGTSLFVQGTCGRLSPAGELEGGAALTESLELVIGP